ncbi:MAG: N-acetylmuramoyl-L-alanine amidase [Bacteroides sp.]|nr:N-acetylmuramoyl-L-alanine amidase [Bacteroides sp.]
MKKLLSLLLILCALTAGAASKTPKASKTKKARTTKVVKTASVPRPAREPFVRRVDSPTASATGGLTGKNIALWQSHGRYFDQNEDRWTWQRARLMGTVEDLYPQAYVLPYLIPMLENAGAYVLTPRERDVSTLEIIVDNDGGYAQDGYSEKNGSKKWRAASDVSGFGYKKEILTGTDNPFRMGTVREVRTVKDPKKASTACWYADFEKAGTYAVYVSYVSLPNSARDARYIVNSLAGSEEFEVNQHIGGGTWVYLGSFPFAAGKSPKPVVELLNVSAEDNKVVTADAVKIGGGMGNVSRSAKGGEATVSQYPRFTEGARYWMQWAGMPSSVYSVTGGKNDYEDDYKSRGMWVNYLAGGSSELPRQKGLGIPIDLSFAFHTDAGTTADASSTIGTMPIVYTKGAKLGNGESRTTSQRYAELVTDQVVNDIQTLYEPTWNRRKLRDRPYHEAMEPQVPSMLIELLSHQNFADMRYGLDPTFRFTVSRAIYKGILKYLHEKDGIPYVVQPLPVSHFTIGGSGSEYHLSWQGVDDPLEPTAKPTYYIVYERIDGGAFSELAVVDDPEITVNVNDSHIYSYKIVAANDGGLSFPSEILSLCYIPDSENPQVLVVNGFTRISGPAEIYAEGKVGFDYEEDHGVPFVGDIHFTGYQTEFRPEVKWTTNDSPGHGASRATHETEMFAGNTFDFVYVHGRSIRAAGFPFISCGVDAFVDRDNSSAKIIDLILGKQKEIAVGTSQERKFKPFTDELKQRLSEFCDAGGSLFVSGSYIGSDLFDNSFSDYDTRMADRLFGNAVLGIQWRQSKATLTGKVREIRSRYTEFRGGLSLTFNQQLNSDCYAVESPESFAPMDTGCAAPIMRYTENDYIAGVAFDPGTHRVVAIGFPFETITGAYERDALMAQILNFFTAPEGSHPGARPKVLPETIIGLETRPTVPPSPYSRNIDPRETAQRSEEEDSTADERKRRRKGDTKSQQPGNTAT